jgi:hypothetical protein
MVKKREPVERIWRKTDVEVADLTLNGVKDTYMRVWLHTIDIWATPGYDRPNPESKSPAYTCTIEGIESFARQLLDVAEKAKEFRTARAAKDMQ